MQNNPNFLTNHNLEPGDIHIYKLALDNLDLSDRRDLLSREEITRADRFRYPLHCGRFIAGRAALRILLGKYLKMSPGDIQIEYTASGKPYLSGHDTPLSFNVSNSGGLCLIALGEFDRIGIDIEKIEPDKQHEDIARRFFAPAEFDELMTFDAAARIGAFYACWTRKEAFVKALGTGLVYGLDRFVVSANHLEPARLISIDGDPKEWSLCSIDVEANYASALAVHGMVRRVIQVDWNDI